MPFKVCGLRAAILLLHLACSFSIARGDTTADLAKMLTQFDALDDAHKTAAAEVVGKKALALAEQTKKPRDIITWLDRLTSLYRAAGRYGDAEPYSKRALEQEGKLSGTDHVYYAQALSNRANLVADQGKYADAETLFKRALAIRQKQLAADDDDVASSLNNLAAIYKDEAKYEEAEPLYKRALAIWEKKAAANSTKTSQGFVAVGLSNLAHLYVAQSKYGQAEPLFKRALAIDEKQFGSTDALVARDLNNLAELEERQGRYSEAESLFRRSLEIFEKQLGPNHPKVAILFNNLAVVSQDQAKYADAEKYLKRALAIREKLVGSDDLSLANTLNNLASLDSEQGKYADAEQHFQRALAIYEKNLGAEHPEVAVTLSNLANLYRIEGKLAEAEPLHKRALAISEKRLGPNHLVVAQSLYNLARLYQDQGKNADAELLCKRSIAIYEKQLGPNHSNVATALDNLAQLYQCQGQYAEAEPLYKRALAIFEKQLGPENPHVAISLNNLAELYKDQEKYVEAEPLLRRAQTINKKNFGPDHPSVANSFESLGELDLSLGKYADAEPRFKQAIAILEKQLGAENVSLAVPLGNLAQLYTNQNNPTAAEPLFDRAIEILESTKTAPDQLLKIYEKRASLNWRAGRREEALTDQRRAIELAEQIRGEGSGTEQDRAKLFGLFSSAFETMLGWQIELGSGGEALAVLERGRSRSLLDELAMSGHDLDTGRSAAERESLVKQEADLHQKIASLEKQLAVRHDAEALKILNERLASAREDLVQFHKEERAASPVYRSLLSVGASSVRLSQLQRKLLSDGGLLWAFWLGENDSYLLAITSDKVRSYKLELTEETARILGLKAGSLTTKDVATVLSAEGNAGLLAQLKNPKPDAAMNKQLHAMWQLLVPEVERKEAFGSNVKRLIVMPDGPLANLPFEALVVDDGDDPIYLLDKGPPILYAPSATVLYNLSERAVSKNNRDNKPIFTLGDPSYSQGANSSSDDSSAQDSLTTVSRYGELGGKLGPLPHTATESTWIVENFLKVGIAASQLLKTTATEQNVRQNIAGRTLIHLACHGLVDQSYGNFFGALAVTPGPKGSADPSDDGYLTLPEIYQLDLKGTELAILSACETNMGPTQQGEGIWALSRGFLVAGSRRVVATDWLVDDEAAANLVSYLTAGIAKQQIETGAVNYAASLQSAKRWVRQQPKWSAPYYWAPFVMIGPK